jgi:GDPmannose 4,6-dehydratase
MDTTQKVALIFGITGQVGSYLAELLLSKGYRVISLLRKTSAILPLNIRHFQNRIELISGDLSNSLSLAACLSSPKKSPMAQPALSLTGKIHPGSARPERPSSRMERR